MTKSVACARSPRELKREELMSRRKAVSWLAGRFSLTRARYQVTPAGECRLSALAHLESSKLGMWKPAFSPPRPPLL